MFATILAFITGLAGPLSTIASKIIDLQEAKINATSAEKKDKITQQIEESHDRRSEIIAQAGDRLATIVTNVARFALTIPTVIVLNKLMVWDKVVGSIEGCSGNSIYPSPEFSCYMFNTDPLSTNEWFAIGAVLAFFFSYDIFMKRT